MARITRSQSVKSPSKTDARGTQTPTSSQQNDEVVKVRILQNGRGNSLSEYADALNAIAESPEASEYAIDESEKGQDDQHGERLESPELLLAMDPRDSLAQDTNLKSALVILRAGGDDLEHSMVPEDLWPLFDAVMEALYMLPLGSLDSIQLIQQLHRDIHEGDRERWDEYRQMRKKLFDAIKTRSEQGQILLNVEQEMYRVEEQCRSMSFEQSDAPGLRIDRHLLETINLIALLVQSLGLTRDQEYRDEVDSESPWAALEHDAEPFLPELCRGYTSPEVLVDFAKLLLDLRTMIVYRSVWNRFYPQVNDIDAKDMVLIGPDAPIPPTWQMLKTLPCEKLRDLIENRPTMREGSIREIVADCGIWGMPVRYPWTGIIRSVFELIERHDEAAVKGLSVITEPFVVMIKPSEEEAPNQSPAMHGPSRDPQALSGRTICDSLPPPGAQEQSPDENTGSQVHARVDGFDAQDVPQNDETNGHRQGLVEQRDGHLSRGGVTGTRSHPDMENDDEVDDFEYQASMPPSKKSKSSKKQNSAQDAATKRPRQSQGTGPKGAKERKKRSLMDRQAEAKRIKFESQENQQQNQNIDPAIFGDHLTVNSESASAYPSQVSLEPVVGGEPEDPTVPHEPQQSHQSQQQDFQKPQHRQRQNHPQQQHQVPNPEAQGGNPSETLLASQIYRAANEQARELVSQNRMTAQRQVRVPWTNDEVDALIRSIAEFGTSYSLIKERDQENGQKLTRRDQVALKDKARNMKMDYLKASPFLPRNFEKVPLSKILMARLASLNIIYDPITGQRSDGVLEQ